jgi:hypothetical protein
LLPRVTFFDYEALRAMIGYQKNNNNQINNDVVMKNNDSNDLYQNNGELSSDEEIEENEHPKKKKIENFSNIINQVLDQEKYENYNDILRKFNLDDFLLNFTK